jgi:hypothetical protein
MRPPRPKKAGVQQTAEHPQKGSAAANLMRTSPPEQTSLQTVIFGDLEKKWMALPTLALSEHNILYFSKMEYFSVS